MCGVRGGRGIGAPNLGVCEGEVDDYGGAICYGVAARLMGVLPNTKGHPGQRRAAPRATRAKQAHRCSTRRVLP